MFGPFGSAGPKIEWRELRKGGPEHLCEWVKVNGYFRWQPLCGGWARYHTVGTGRKAKLQCSSCQDRFDER